MEPEVLPNIPMTFRFQGSRAVLVGRRLPLRRSCYLVVSGLLCFTVITVVNIFIASYSSNLLITGNRFWSSSPVPCDSRWNIVFLKTHKCASSSIQNILLRYGDEHNLTFVLPTKNNYFGHPDLFQRIFVPDSLNRTFNILTHHTRYNRPEMNWLMPPDTVYVTIVRSPIDLLESLYSYYNLRDYYRMDLQTMSRNKSRILSTLGERRYYRRVGLNQMSFDLGLNYSQFEDGKAIRDFCKKIDSEFDLVLVYERLDESLVLLADLMCWSLEDVVAFRLNARKDKYRTKLSYFAVKRLKDLSAPDIALYEHFAQKFQSKVEEYGAQRMAVKVRELKNITQRLFEYCVEGIVPDSNATNLGFNAKYVVRYKKKNANDIVCQRMLRYELTYTEMLRRKQRSPAF